MRPLSKSEKKIVEKLCEKKCSLSELFDKEFLKDLAIQVTNDALQGTHSIGIIVKENTSEYYAKKLFESTEQVVNVINLIEYLEREAYIFKFRPAHGRTVEGYIGLKEFLKDYNSSPSEYAYSPFADEHSISFVINYMDLTYSSTEALKVYKEQNYRTSEEVRHRQNKIIAWTAIAISMALGIIGMFDLDCLKLICR